MIILLLFCAAPPLDPLPPGAVARLGEMRLNLGSGISSLAWTPDGSQLIACGSSAPPAFFDARTGDRRRTLPTLGYAASLSMPPSGDALLVAGEWLELSDLRTGKHRWRIRVLALSAVLGHRGEWVAVSSYPRGLEIHDGATGKPLGRTLGERFKQRAIAADPSRHALAVLGSSGLLEVFDPRTGERSWKARAHTTRGSFDRPALAYHPKCEWLASGSSDGTVRLWHPATGKPGRVLHRGPRACVSLAASGSLLAASFSDGSLRVFDPASGAVSWRLDADAMGELAFSPDGRVLAGGTSTSGNIRLWDAATGKRLLPAIGHEGTIVGLMFQGESRLVARDATGASIRWDAGKPTRFPRLRRAFVGEAISPDGRLVALSVREGLAIHRIADGARVRLLDGGEVGQARALAWSRCGRRIAGYFFEAREMIMWDATNGKVLRDTIQPRHGGSVTALCFSPDARRLLILRNGTAVIRQLDPFKETVAFTLRETARPCIEWSPDGRWIAAVAGRRVLLWDAERGEKGRIWEHGHDEPTGVAFSPDGRLLATIGSDTGRVWEAASGQPVRRLRAPRGRLSRVAFSPSGRVLATGASDGTIHLWDGTGRLTRQRTGNAWERLKGEADDAHDAAWESASNEGVRLLAGKLVPQTGPMGWGTLLERMDSDDFATRRRAEDELERLGPGALPDVRRALASGVPLEVGKRLERLAREWIEGAEALRIHRAVMALEHAASKEADALLAKLAKGAPGAPLTEEAKKALDRRKR
ncbi:MAG: WD40 repeat domain-containing protein [Gemmataceae bacterium]|nr:WD40 repeat domain-containing protein [Gemmataceae bacterium]